MARARLEMAVAAGFVSLALFAVWPVPALTIQAGTGRTVLERAVSDPVAVRLEYVHSVERTPVAEVYEAGRGGVRLVRMEFASQGAGLPSSGYLLEEGRLVLRTNRLLPLLTLRVSRVNAPCLSVGADVMDLVSLVGQGGVVTIRVTRRPRLATLLPRRN